MSYPPGPPPPGAGEPDGPGGYGPPGSGQPWGYGPVPTSEERNWALASHVGALVAAWVAMGFLAPLIIMLVKGNDSAFVRRHSVESLNFQISLLIYGVVAVIVTIVTLGLALVVVVPAAIAALVLIILATIKAANGEEYRYPLTLRLVS